MLPRLPAVLGNGVAGVVTSVGEGVAPLLVGSRVITSTGGVGGYAELAAVPAEGLIAVPGALALDDAAALLADGRTAMALTAAAQPKPHETVLVEAAAGGVGSLLLRLAKNAGCRVVAVASTTAKLDVARRLGADLTVNYQDPDWTATVRAEAGGVDVAYDGVGGQIGQDAFTLLNPGGRYCAFGMASGSFARIPDDARPDIHRVTLAPLSPAATRELVRAALAEAVGGRLRPVIGQRFPLQRAADAHAVIEARGTIGKTLLVPAGTGPP
jgi:NADPH2:quinone reductase